MKNLLFSLLFTAVATASYSQNNTYQLSSHILDISSGTAAIGVPVVLEKYDETTKIWSYVDEKITDKNGRITDFLNYKETKKGIYKLRFLVADYFKSKKTDSFYPFIEVVFQIKDTNHYHVPITLSSYGYATYRGN
ncbi:hydroxyisourate hydrolase [Flavobacterium psychrolimnae]|jgi:5-hydroxyisourate hydrolase|uniref:5-hydroxyisourate hydrolase n=1 Tax=Flavobacterium psychrolimnae TaxID=249351 RepID=A0A366B4M9_9FLAO|nr:hydroxyisourate hydrolase [Flavobacterium psychrolimnae]RBN51821.1 hydroxyisourate hydrolase [Flavobacterium psychrolimnae]